MVRVAALTLTTLWLLATPVAARAFGFTCVSGGGTDCTVGEAQLVLDVDTAGAGQVAFDLSNTGPTFFSAAQVFFDDALGLLASLVSVIDGSGVNFEAGGSPADLPGGTTIGFTADHHASATSPAPRRGVNPGESVRIVFSLAVGTTLGDVLAALGSGELRVGVHAIGFADRGSRSFVSAPGPVPEPGALGLLGVAGLLAFARRHRRA